MPPFTVLHVCMGNICRSPMAERLFATALRQPPGDQLVLSHSAGTGGWHAGEQMHPSAGRQVRSRGGDPDGFAARRLRAEHVEAADLVLVATADQQEYVAAMRPDAAARTFVFGELGRLLRRADLAALPPADPTPDAVHTRGLALVTALAALRDGAAPRPEDDLDDPWGQGEETFGRVADELEQVLLPLATALLGAEVSLGSPARPG